MIIIIIIKTIIIIIITTIIIMMIALIMIIKIASFIIWLRTSSNNLQKLSTKDDISNILQWY